MKIVPVLLFLFAAAYASRCGRKPASPPAAEPRKLAADYLDGSLRPLLERYEQTREISCKKTSLAAYGETRVGVVGAAILKSVLAGEKPVDRLKLGWFPLPILPAAQLTQTALTGVEQGVADARKLKLVALYRIEQAQWPVVRGKSKADITGFTIGRLSVSTLLMDYGTREPLCRFLFEVKNDPYLRFVTESGYDGEGGAGQALELDL